METSVLNLRNKKMFKKKYYLLRKLQEIVLLVMLITA